MIQELSAELRWNEASFEQKEKWVTEHFAQESNRCCSHAFRWISCLPPACGFCRESSLRVSASVRIWNLGLTPYTHSWASIEKRKLTAVLLVLINFAALQWDNDYNQISCFKASGSGKNNTLHATTSTCSKSLWDLMGESFHFPWAQACWGPWEISTCLCTWRWFYCLRWYKPTLSAASFGKWVMLSLSKTHQFDIRCPGICRKAGEFIWHSALDLISVKEVIENKFQTESENILLFLYKC